MQVSEILANRQKREFGEFDGVQAKFFFEKTVTHNSLATSTSPHMN